MHLYSFISVFGVAPNPTSPPTDPRFRKRPLQGSHPIIIDDCNIYSSHKRMFSTGVFKRPAVWLPADSSFRRW